MTSTPTTTPVEGALEWSVQKSPPQRRRSRRRFSRCADKILETVRDKALPAAALVCVPEGRAPVREGAALFADAKPRPTQIGKVTSGGFGPSLNAPVAMGYLPTSLFPPPAPPFSPNVRGQRLSR